jgi:hypothetical protein
MVDQLSQSRLPRRKALVLRVIGDGVACAADIVKGTKGEIDSSSVVGMLRSMAKARLIEVVATNGIVSHYRRAGGISSGEVVAKIAGMLGHSRVENARVLQAVQSLVWASRERQSTDVAVNRAQARSYYETARTTCQKT